MSRTSQQKASAYNLGREDALKGRTFKTHSSHFVKQRKPLDRSYTEGYVQGLKERKSKKSPISHKAAKRVFWVVFVLLVGLTYHYVTEYLCDGSPIVPLRCKSFPWE